MSNTFTNEEFERAFNKIYDDITSDKTKQDKPKVVFLCGQPGAGKSRCGQLYAEQFNKDVVKSDVDEYREEHPHFDEIVAKNPYNWSVDTHEFASKMGYAIVKKLASEKYNVIIDGTLRNLQKTKELISMFKNNGYDNVEIAVTATKPDISKTQIILRYVNALEKKTPARLVPFGVHNDAIVSIPKNLNVIESENVVDSIKIYDRDCLLLYNSLQSKSQALLSGDMLEQIYSTRPNKYEQAWLKQTIDEIYPKLDPEDNETLELLKELKKINGEYKMDNDVVEKDNTLAKRFMDKVKTDETYYYIWYTTNSKDSYQTKSYYVDYYSIDQDKVVTSQTQYYGKISKEALDKAIFERQQNDTYVEINKDEMQYFEDIKFEQQNGGYEMEEQKNKNYIFINRIANSKKEENNGKIAISVKIGDDVKFSRKSEETDEIKASKELLEAYDQYLKDHNFPEIQDFIVLSKLEALQDYKTKADLVNQFKFCKEMPLNNQDSARKQINYCCVNVLDGEFSKQNAGKISLTMRMGNKTIFNAKSDKTDKIEATKELLDQFNEYSKNGGYDNSDKRFYVMSNFKEELLTNREAFSVEKYPYLDFGTQPQAEEKINNSETQEKVAENTETFVITNENGDFTMPF